MVNPAPEIEDMPEIAGSSNTSFVNADTLGSTMKSVDLMEVTAKRGRGRPRKVSTTPQDVSGKHGRGRPVGSTKKAKGKQKDVKDPSFFIHTSVVKSHMSTANTSTTEHIYDMVMVTISPHETTPPVVTKHASSEVSSQHVMVAGPSKEGRSISRTARLPMLSSLGP